MFKAQQNEVELAQFVDVLRREQIRSYLEIGSKWGGSLWKVAQILPEGARIVSVDLPQPKSGTEQSLRSCIAALKERGFKVAFLEGDSTDPLIIDQVKTLGPFDACLIDANHTMDYVSKDWTNYGSLSRIVAFHDISWKGPRPGRLPVDVPRLWSELKQHYRHVEIRLEARDNGFGILWRS